MTLVLHGLVSAKVHLDGYLSGYRTDNPPPPPPPGNPGGVDWNKFQPDGGAVPKSGLFVSMGQGALWLALALSFVAFAGGIVMWVAGPIFGSQYAAQAGKTQMWKGLTGIVLGAAAISIVTWVVALVGRS